MKSILYTAPFCHVPPMDGASQRGLNLLEQLLPAFRLHWLTYQKPGWEYQQAWAQERGIPLHWLPGPPQGSSKMGYFARLVSRQAPGFASHDPQGTASCILSIFQQHGPFDILYFATQLVGQSILHLNLPVKHVLDLYDIYTPLARKRFEDVSPLRRYHWLFRREAQRVQALEARVFKRFERLLVVSESDYAAARRIAPGAVIQIVPNGVSLPVNWQSDERQPHVLMVANYSHSPNAEGFRWFYQQVWSQVLQAAPQARLLLAGKDSTPLQPLTGGDPSVEWLGAVPDLASLYCQSACAVVPVLSGGGTRLKLLEAMSFGIPVVTTSLGASGIDHQGSVALADDAQTFASLVAERLISPGSFWEQAARARQVVAECYTWEKIGIELAAALEAI